MHELAICQSIIDQVSNISKQRNAKHVASISIGIGPLSGVEEQLLRNAYPIASVSTVAENAELIIETLPVRVHCNQCGEDSDAKINKLSCPHCGNWRTTLISGDEMLLLSVELEMLKQ
jgi:hydrogenase nickel incorporation protein HypA/HybF